MSVVNTGEKTAIILGKSVSDTDEANFDQQTEIILVTGKHSSFFIKVPPKIEFDEDQFDNDQFQ